MNLVSVIVPAYNEAARIRTTLEEVLDYFDRKSVACELVVAADGNDGTREAARALGRERGRITVIGETTRSGKGRGIREGVRLAQGDVIGFADADNKTPISEFDKVERFLRDGYDVVIGSRGLPESRIERAQRFYRRLGSRGFALAVHVCVGLADIADTQCGFKFFRGDVARDLFRRQQIDGSMFDVEILYLAQRLGYQIAQVPVRWRDDGDSRLQLIAGNLRNLRDVVTIRWRHRHLTAAVPAQPALPRDERR